uniref:Uncharacterized protein n=1 Tax=Chenopodium quinoa TaxID=63459 RepID=A0A803LM66_CHEQI
MWWAYHFTGEWARLARGEPLEVAPFLDQRILQSEDDVDGSITREIDDGGSMKHFRQVGIGKKGDNVTPIFKLVTNDEIERLKEAANNSNNRKLSRPYSPFEVISL